VGVEQRHEPLPDHAGCTEDANLELLGHCATESNKSRAVVEAVDLHAGAI
jgi:hypothetical protein